MVISDLVPVASPMDEFAQLMVENVGGEDSLVVHDFLNHLVSGGYGDDAIENLWSRTESTIYSRGPGGRATC